ncbi:MAG TPA: transcription antitermination factor NusB, partial [Candidatus Omnitrophica bacterium]|nr:transcription antitermination factor NusB [Candidatus Omnitrophota bacterium]
YQIDIGGQPSLEATESVLKDENDSEVKKFSSRLIKETRKNIAQIDSIIEKHAFNWELERMAVIDRNVLRLGVYEVLYCESIPPRVTLNEAIELAKKYGDNDSGRFVNGILDKIIRFECPQKSGFLNE